MRASTKMIRLCAVIPAGLAGICVAIMALPGTAVVVGFPATLLVSIGLVCGWWEAPAARVFGGARGLRPGQRAVLEPALQRTRTVGLAPERVLVRLTATDGVPATPIGRHTVIVEPWLIQGMYERRLSTTDAASVISHAVASARVGPARFDLAARLWAFPFTLLLVVIRGIARMFSWVPTGELVWHLRIVIGVVALHQGFQPGGDPVVGSATATLVAISYLAPAADLRWRAVVERDADRWVGRCGLGGPLIDLAQWRDGAASMERVHRIRAGEAGSSSGRRQSPGEPVLVHTTARRTGLSRGSTC